MWQRGQEQTVRIDIHDRLASQVAIKAGLATHQAGGSEQKFRYLYEISLTPSADWEETLLVLIGSAPELSALGNP